ncbi:hypothetical protein DP107_01140 [Haloglomus irregulare]|jgi:hypothetical protein|uniref:Uncharacterized protein n=1 Tax=Haloglomus irregulare TaxID=2234134 RepID=A0A554NEK9_9EURY|nr:hypothetical protein [Haloglomus irregulare]TSD15816.1 hypothetical protein DP107_01140 [Haloglomus irregulare]
MRARDRQDIVEEVVESNADPAGWRAIAGDRRDGLGEDLFLGHPDAGVFQLKTYARTPFDVQGVGGEVARRIDDDLDPLFPDEDDGGRFGVQSAPEDEDAETEVAEELEAVIETHADAPTTGDALFADVMEALDAPAFGPMEYEFDDRPDELDDLSDVFEAADELLSTELDDLIEADGVGRGFH